MNAQTSTKLSLTLNEAQEIAERIVGPVHWIGAQGHCKCPGIELHTNPNAATDCTAVCVPTDSLIPGVYCFHDSCKDNCDDASYQLRSALGKRQCGQIRTWKRTTRIAPPKPQFSPEKLERIARKLDGIDADWLAARSPKCVWNRTPASFLHELYVPSERVIVFDTFKSQGQTLWKNEGVPFNARVLDEYRTGKREGVWFLSNPVTGEYVPDGKTNKDGTPHLSRRSWHTVTAWRYMVLESDKANTDHWLAALAQMPLPIAAIYTSGGRSIHALIRINADSKEHWDSIANELKPMLITLGADRAAITAVRLTRLPCCRREEKDAMQTLLYLNGNPDQTPLCEKGEK